LLCVLNNQEQQSTAAKATTGAAGLPFLTLHQP